MSIQYHESGGSDMTIPAPPAPTSETPAALRPAPLIRAATRDDMSRLQQIYATYVNTSTATFELNAPSTETLIERRAQILADGGVYIVAEVDGRVGGYAYAGLYRARPAYRHTVENSIYIDDTLRGRGVGRALLEELMRQCRDASFHEMIAVVGGGEKNPASIGLHAKAGFRMVGILEQVGCKFGEWVDCALMQASLSPPYTSGEKKAIKPVV
jgi:phosphinothricin acetyltransferase